ncbi:AraC family transcriptional regulator [Streptomyces resistomycificus]|uniref:Transcriptional regulator n=1 Tax=Streptomyces resistomycificus TaxID=67356 RepID=A0A0L8L485_9ACTN|nr:helix-turn-helix domain-containing protein [Streptomyces resistomycificus]KOG32904.1 transcriptional regulator [Streptomyces resistomycificus]KUO01252.1 transcriptional regulator [Streptomyces resistomycificus]
MTNALAERTATVPTALRPWITGIESVAARDALPASFTHVPDTATKLVVRVEEGGRRDAVVVGPRTRASYYADADRRVASCVQVSLGPGTARPLLGTPAADLVGRVVPLSALPTATARQLASDIVDLETEEVIAHLAELLPGLPAPAGDRSRTRVLRAAVAALSTRSGHAPAQVQDVARELAVSERQLRNLFTEGVGLSPKHYARIDRVRHVLTQAPRGDWAELAAATGYYDQSHMTADFRTLMGVPPRSYFTGRLPSARPCQAFRQV